MNLDKFGISFVANIFMTFYDYLTHFICFFIVDISNFLEWMNSFFYYIFANFSIFGLCEVSKATRQFG